MAVASELDLVRSLGRRLRVGRTEGEEAGWTTGEPAVVVFFFPQVQRKS